jgi:hypothetical protein
MQFTKYFSERKMFKSVTENQNKYFMSSTFKFCGFRDNQTKMSEYDRIVKLCVFFPASVQFKFPDYELFRELNSYAVGSSFLQPELA